MHRAPLPPHVAALVAQLNTALADLHANGDEISVVVVDVTRPTWCCALPQLHADLVQPDVQPDPVAADVAVLPIAPPHAAAVA